MATPDFKPRSDSEGNLGQLLFKWLKGFFVDVHVSGVITDGSNSFTVAALSPPVYGTELNIFTEPLLITNTNNGVDVMVINTNTSALTTGDHLIMISTNASCDSNSSDGIIFFDFDGSPLTPTTGNSEIWRIESKDSAGNNPPGAQTAQKHAVSIIYPVTVSTAGAKSVRLYIRPEANGVEMNTWNTSIITYKLS